MWIEMLGHSFMRTALTAGLVIGAVSSLLSFFVVQKGLAFAGAGISHAAFGGLALGTFLDRDPLLVGGVFAVGTALILANLSKGKTLTPDIAIGIAFSGSMAMGVILISVSRGQYFGELFSYLFGNILAVSSTELWAISLLALIVGAFMWLFFRGLLIMTLSKDVACAQGVPVRWLDCALLTAVAITVILSVRLVGVVLASALLVLPGAIGHMLSGHYRGVIAVSMGTALLSITIGLGLSYRLDWPAGASIVATLVAKFIVTTLLFSSWPSLSKRLSGSYIGRIISSEKR